jgi:hypothetical protein
MSNKKIAAAALLASTKWLALPAMLLIAPVRAATIVENYTLNLALGTVESGFVDASGHPVQEYLANVPFPDPYSTLNLAPGDTYQLNVHFTGGAIQLGGGLATQDESIALYDSGNAAGNPTRFNLDLNEALLFAGVQGSLLQNPVSAEISGLGGLPFAPPPQNLTDSQFSFTGFQLTINPVQYSLVSGDGHLDALVIAFSSDTVQVVPVPAAAWLLLSGLGLLAALSRRSAPAV